MKTLKQETPSHVPTGEEVLGLLADCLGSLLSFLRLVESWGRRSLLSLRGIVKGSSMTAGRSWEAKLFRRSLGPHPTVICRVGGTSLGMPTFEELLLELPRDCEAILVWKVPRAAEAARGPSAGSVSLGTVPFILWRWLVTVGWTGSWERGLGRMASPGFPVPGAPWLILGGWLVVETFLLQDSQHSLL